MREREGAVEVVTGSTEGAVGGGTVGDMRGDTARRSGGGDGFHSQDENSFSYVHVDDIVVN